MDSKTNLHGSVLGKDDFVAPRDNMGVNGPACSVESETGTDRPEVSYQADHGACQSETRSASHCPSAEVGAVGSPPFSDASTIMRVETVKRRDRQKHIDGGRDELCFGSDTMSATLRVDFDVAAGSGINALQCSLNRSSCHLHRAGTSLNMRGRSRSHFDFPKREAKLSISAQAACRPCLRHDPFQSRPFGKNQLMVGGKYRLRYHRIGRRSLMVGG